MKSNKIFIACLRRPANARDLRPDPFWEFGSFGCTGCHDKNLLHPKNSNELIDGRIAFAQGGCGSIRLVYLSPPITKRIIYYSPGKGRCRTEVRWDSSDMPFRFNHAPVLIDNKGKTETPLLKQYISTGNRTTWCGKFASKFRGRRRALNIILSNEIVEAYNVSRKQSGKEQLATIYVEALPYLPKNIDMNRLETYNHYIGKLKKCS